MRLDNNFFNNLVQLLEGMGKEQYIPQLKKQQSKYLSPEIRVGTWGQFSSGKSSFINALIGRDVLPVNITESTSNIVEIRYGVENNLRLYYGDKVEEFYFSKELALISMAGASSFEKLKPSQKKAVDEDKFNEVLKKLEVYGRSPDKVELRIDSDFLKSGVVLVDLPGLNGSGDNQFLTYKKIQECEIVLYFKAPDRPLDKFDNDVIERLGRRKKDMIAFAVQTKSDLLYKNQIDDLNTLGEEALYSTFLNDFKSDLSGNSFDGYFLLSPLAYLVLKESSTEDEAFNKLKSFHKNKFRFLRETHDLSVVSGQRYFDDRFFYSLEDVKDKAKEYMLKSQINFTLSTISKEVEQRFQQLMIARDMKKSEFEEYSRELDAINKKINDLKNTESKLASVIASGVEDLVKGQYHEWISEALSMVPTQRFRYQDVDEVSQEISFSLEKVLSEKIKHPKTKKFLDDLISEALSDFSKDLAYIESSLDNFTKKICEEKSADDSVLGFIHEFKNKNGERHEFNYFNNQMSGLEVTGLGVSGIVGAVATEVMADAVLDGVLGLFGGFGVFTLLKGAFRGGTNGDGVGAGMWNAVCNIFDAGRSVTGSKQGEISLILRRLETTGERRSFAADIYDKTHLAFKGSLTTVMTDEISKKLKDTDIISLLSSRCQSQRDMLQSIYENEHSKADDIEAELLSVQKYQKDFESILSEYGFYAQEDFKEVA